MVVGGAGGDLVLSAVIFILLKKIVVDVEKLMAFLSFP